MNHKRESESRLLVLDDSCAIINPAVAHRGQFELVGDFFSGINRINMNIGKAAHLQLANLFEGRDVIGSEAETVCAVIDDCMPRGFETTDAFEIGQPEKTIPGNAVSEFERMRREAYPEQLVNRLQIMRRENENAPVFPDAADFAQRFHAVVVGDVIESVEAEKDEIETIALEGVQGTDIADFETVVGEPRAACLDHCGGIIDPAVFAGEWSEKMCRSPGAHTDIEHAERRQVVAERIQEIRFRFLQFIVFYVIAYYVS